MDEQLPGEPVFHLLPSVSTENQEKTTTPPPPEIVQFRHIRKSIFTKPERFTLKFALGVGGAGFCVERCVFLRITTALCVQTPAVCEKLVRLRECAYGDGGNKGASINNGASPSAGVY